MTNATAEVAHLAGWLQGAVGKVLSPVWHSASQRQGHHLAPVAQGCRIFLPPRKIAYVMEEWLHCTSDVRNLLIEAVVAAENLGNFCYSYVGYYVLQSRELYVCFYVCSLWVNILQAFTEVFTGACSLLSKWGFILFAVCIYSLSVTAQYLTAQYWILEQGTAVLMGTFCVKGVTGEFLSTLKHSIKGYVAHWDYIFIKYILRIYSYYIKRLNSLGWVTWTSYFLQWQVAHNVSNLSLGQVTVVSNYSLLNIYTALKSFGHKL